MVQKYLFLLTISHCRKNLSNIFSFTENITKIFQFIRNVEIIFCQILICLVLQKSDIEVSFMLFSKSLLMNIITKEK